jgi:hypothetical protein
MFWLYSCSCDRMNKFFLVTVIAALVSCNRPEKPATADSTASQDTPAAVSSPAVAEPEVPVTRAPDPVEHIRQKVSHINTASLTKKHFGRCVRQRRLLL